MLIDLCSLFALSLSFSSCSFFFRNACLYSRRVASCVSTKRILITLFYAYKFKQLECNRWKEIARTSFQKTFDSMQKVRAKRCVDTSGSRKISKRNRFGRTEKEWTRDYSWLVSWLVRCVLKWTKWICDEWLTDINWIIFHVMNTNAKNYKIWFLSHAASRWNSAAQIFFVQNASSISLKTLFHIQPNHRKSART